MSRDRLLLGHPATADGPWLAAILDVLDDIQKTLVGIRNQGGAVYPQPVKVQEPAPDLPPLPAPPPRAGRAASADAWQAWAAGAGVAVTDGASRADIIAACEKAGVLHKEP